MLNTNYHVATIKNTGSFEPSSLQTKTLPVYNIQEIRGKLEDGSVEVQAYRFPAYKFSAEDAKKWLENQRQHSNSACQHP